jgi:hypothetical protein
VATLVAVMAAATAAAHAEFALEGVGKVLK